MSRYFSIALGVVAIVALTIPEITISNRFKASNVKAEQFAALLADIPKDIGYWHGEDLPVEEQTRRTAGAVGYVSRAYRNVRTGEVVTLWLIVGHARDITAHTPEICYPASGFTKRSPDNSLHPFIVEGEPQADFFTNTFIKEDATGRQLVRVFWSWYRPNDEDTIKWQAPEHARWTFGNTRALYKMYFSSVMRSPKETTEESPCSRFARDFLPVVDKALAENNPLKAAADAAKADSTATEPATPAAPAEST